MKLKAKAGLLIHPEEISRCWNERLASTNVELLGIHPAGGATAHHSLAEAIETLKNPEKQSLLAALRQRGIQIEYEMHAMSWLLPRALFQTHPAWFRLNERGERTNDMNCCPSNKDALDFVSQRAALLAKAFPCSSGRYHFWHDDGARMKCHCPECASLTSSDEALLICNAILKGLRTFDPQATQSYLAYFSTLPAPRKIEPESGIFLEYAPMDREFDKPLADAGSPKNRQQLAYLDDLFACFGRSNAQVLDYWLDNSCFSGWKKPPKKLELNETVLCADAALYRERGFAFITSFACFLGEDYERLHGKTTAVAAFDAAIQG